MPATANAQQFNESGKTIVDGRTLPYVIRRLPASSFPDLPDAVAEMLDQRGCMIPQTYQAHRPENVVHASFERPGSSDWAVLCATHGNVELLVFFARTPGKADAHWLPLRNWSGCSGTVHPVCWASTGALIPLRRSRFARRRQAWSTIPRCSTTTRWRTPC